MQIVKTRLYVAFLMLPLLIPHLLFYYFSPRKTLIKSDIGGVKNLFITWFMISLIGTLFIID